MTLRGVERIAVIPSASRLVGSLRDLGYEFPQAVADLVDNSVTAGARRVSIDLSFEGPDSWLRIVDDGDGMDSAALTEAMRYGSKQSYEDEDLGKFGLGLKTASLSQCRKVTVASRVAPSRARVGVRRLDLDHVLESDRWEILAPDSASADIRVIDPLREGPGTVVLWESLDRILGYKIPWGRRAEVAIESFAEQLHVHLGMIFHRFIAGEVPDRPKLKIVVNGKPVEAWDPFARSEPRTHVLPGVDLDLQTSERVGLVSFQPYVLPPREQFSSDDSFQRHAGPRKWNAQQGIYVYRANRMIQSGGWSRLRAPDEHLKLARASLDFYPELDSAFEVNVAKVRVSLPADLRERLAVSIDHWVRSAQAAYREHPSDASQASSKRALPRQLPAAGRMVERAAQDVGEGDALRRIVRRLRKLDPVVARSLGW